MAPFYKRLIAPQGTDLFGEGCVLSQENKEVEDVGMSVRRLSVAPSILSLIFSISMHMVASLYGFPWTAYDMSRRVSMQWDALPEADCTCAASQAGWIGLQARWECRESFKKFFGNRTYKWEPMEMLTE
jgi:hypothetical protein